LVQESSSRLAAWLAGNRARAAGTRRRNRLATQMQRTSVMRAPILSSEARQLRLTAVAEMKTTTAITPNAINMAHLKGKPHKTRLLQCTNGVVMKELPFGSKFKQRGARFLSSRNKNGPVRRRPFEFKSQEDQAATKFFRCAYSDTLGARWREPDQCSRRVSAFRTSSRSALTSASCFDRLGRTSQLCFLDATRVRFGLAAIINCFRISRSRNSDLSIKLVLRDISDPT